MKYPVGLTILCFYYGLTALPFLYVWHHANGVDRLAYILVYSFASIVVAVVCGMIDRRR